MKKKKIIPINLEFIEYLQKVLIHEVGDHRICPKCKNTFIPKDPTSEGARKAYKKLDKLRKSIHVTD